MTTLTLEQQESVVEFMGPVFDKLGQALGMLKRHRGIVAKVKVNIARGIIEIRFIPAANQPKDPFPTWTREAAEGSK